MCTQNVIIYRNVNVTTPSLPAESYQIRTREGEGESKGAEARKPEAWPGGPGQAGGGRIAPWLLRTALPQTSLVSLQSLLQPSLLV